MEAVEWCVAISTPEEVLLCALKRLDGSPAGTIETSYSLHPTCYTLPTDGKRIISIAGSRKGQIFLGGDDGCLYEMNYEGTVTTRYRTLEDDLEDFYERDVTTPSVLTTSVKRKSNQSSIGPRKCRKLNRSSNVPTIVKAIVPDFLTSATSFLFGGKSSSGGGSIRRILVDEARHCVYTLSTKGWISAFDISSGTVQLKAVMDAVKTTRVYLDEVSKGKMFPRSTSYSSVMGDLIFPGGGSAAQAGVGGMEGARSLVRLADRSPNLLVPTSIHIVAPTESSRVTLMAVTRGGLRLYMSSFSRNALTGAMRNSPIRPSNRLALLHVRAMPAGKDSRSSTCLDINGAVTPGVDKDVQIHAAYYSGESFAAALASPNQGSSASSGSFIISALPDCANRKEESFDFASQEVAATKSKKLVSAGGITEVFTIVGDGFDGDSGSSAVLPGGIVWDIDRVFLSSNRVKALVDNSITPMDSELDVGLPPPYYPPVLRPSPSTHSQALVSSSSLSSAAQVLVGNIIKHYLFRTPYGNSLYTGERPRHAPELRPAYRISSRDGASGFSGSAMEKSLVRSHKNGRTISSTSSHSPISARLRPWLLQPSVAPLSISANQIWETKHEIVAVNAGGVHFFSNENLMSLLSDILLDSGDNLGANHLVRAFFESYGFKEACSMCLGLAIEALPSTNAAILRTRAIEAVMLYGMVPRLVPVDSSVLQTHPRDQFVPAGLDFKPSALYDGLVSLLSRILRPFLHKPLVVVTEGRTIKSPWSDVNDFSPAKVELLLNDETTEIIVKRLKDLEHLLRKVFSRAIEVVPGRIPERSSMMDIDEPFEDRFITDAFQHKTQIGTSSASTQLTSHEAEKLAHLLEEKNIHSLYRFTSRTLQLCRLITLLREADETVELPIVNWGLLHGLTAAQLVQNEEGQDRLESLLNGLLTGVSFGRRGNELVSHKADNIANCLAEECYHFFSAASRYLYFALKTGNEAVSLPFESVRRKKMVEDVSESMKKAAEYWRSAPLVTGSLMHSKKGAKFSEIAKQARDNGSPLARATDCLAELGDVASLVEVCLITAGNFSSTAGLSTSSTLVPRRSREGPSLRWEHDLYHYRRRDHSAESSSQYNSPGRSNVYGTAITSQDAIDTCYSLIFDHMSRLFSRSPALAERMVSVCSYSTNKRFLDQFFSFLMESNNTSVLLRIDSKDLEVWLEKQNDFDLLIRYLVYHEKYLKSGDLSYNRANDTSIKASLAERIELLTRAESSYKNAGKVLGMAGSDSLLAKIKDTEVSLRVAHLQHGVLRHLPSQSVGVDVSEEDYQRLKTGLISVSDLYNVYAHAAGLWGDCLRIIHDCHHDEPGPIEQHWKNIFAEDLLPCATRRRSTYEILENFFSGITDSSVVELLDENSSSVLDVFEEGRWARKLEGRLSELGSQLYGTGFDASFPVDLIVFALESFQRAASSSVEPEWPIKVLVESGVPYMIAMETYETRIMHSDQLVFGDANHPLLLSRLSALVRILKYWITQAETVRGEVQDQLSLALTTGRLLPKVRSLRSRIEEAGGNSSSVVLDDLDRVEAALSYIS